MKVRENSIADGKFALPLALICIAFYRPWVHNWALKFVQGDASCRDSWLSAFDNCILLLPKVAAFFEKFATDTVAWIVICRSTVVNSALSLSWYELLLLSGVPVDKQYVVFNNFCRQSWWNLQNNNFVKIKCPLLLPRAICPLQGLFMMTLYFAKSQVSCRHSICCPSCAYLWTRVQVTS